MFDVGQELTKRLAEYEARRGKLAYRLLVIARERDELEDTIKQLDASAYSTELSMAAWNRYLVELAADEATKKKAEAEKKARKTAPPKNK